MCGSWEGKQLLRVYSIASNELLPLMCLRDLTHVYRRVFTWKYSILVPSLLFIVWLVLTRHKACSNIYKHSNVRRGKSNSRVSIKDFVNYWNYFCVSRWIKLNIFFLYSLVYLYCGVYKEHMRLVYWLEFCYRGCGYFRTRLLSAEASQQHTFIC